MSYKHKKISEILAWAILATCIALLLYIKAISLYAGVFILFLAGYIIGYTISELEN